MLLQNQTAARKTCALKLCLLALFFLVFVFAAPSRAASVTADEWEDSSSESGETATGKWVTKNGAVKYRLKNKTYAKNDFYKINGHWYHFNQQGELSTGWFQLDDGRYYANKNGKAGKLGRLASGWKTFNGKTFFFSQKDGKEKSGRMLTGWQTIGKNTYYFGNDGVMRTGWEKIGGKYFYFIPKGESGVKGKMATGWYTIKKQKYYFRTTGKKGVKGARYKSEWKTIKGKKYYFNKNGTVNTETLTQSQFIKTIGKLASKDMKKSRILASVTTAQAILESGYGTSSLAMEAHNLFGMKATLSGNTWKSAWDGKTFTKSTKEYLNGKWCTIDAPFRAYDTFAESLADHSAYLAYAKNGNRLRYKGVVGNKSYKKTIQIIKNGGYATDPQYVSKVCAIIKKYKLTKYDK